jgi:hypothetical protein
MLLKNTFELFDRDGGGEIETQEVLFTIRISERRMSCAPTFASSVDLLMSIFCLLVPPASPHMRSVFERAAISLSSASSLRVRSYALCRRHPLRRVICSWPALSTGG